MILLLGASGFLGSAVYEKLKVFYPNNFKLTSLSKGLDLTNLNETINYFNKLKPDVIINCASFVGGIQYGEEHSVKLLEYNLMMELSILEACRNSGVKQLINPISNCIYPGDETFFEEDKIWSGDFHNTVESYAFARKMFLIAQRNYNKNQVLNMTNLIFPNMYGPNDHFDEKRSHALGAIIKKSVDYKFNKFVDEKIIIWGSGKPVREWLYVEDAADYIIASVDKKISEPVNIGVGKGISIKELTFLINEILDSKANIVFDLKKNDGAKMKIMNNSKMLDYFKFSPQTSLIDGLKKTINWYLNEKGYSSTI